MITEHPSLEFEKDTGVVWDEFMAAHPSVAAAYI
jgi:hypothetical protein